jgi:hypothetical protein
MGVQQTVNGRSGITGLEPIKGDMYTEQGRTDGDGEFEVGHDERARNRDGGGSDVTACARKEEFTDLKAKTSGARRKERGSIVDARRTRRYRGIGKDGDAPFG